MTGVSWEKGHIRSRIASSALQGGKDSDGTVIYVGRALHSGVFLPAKVIPSKNACYVCESFLIKRYATVVLNDKIYLLKATTASKFSLRTLKS